MVITAMAFVALIIYSSYSFYGTFVKVLKTASTEEDRQNIIALVLATSQVSGYAVALLSMFVVVCIAGNTLWGS